MRTSSVKRKTKETEIELSINLDGKGSSKISTGIEFFDHMLQQIAVHGLIDLEINAKGDLGVDCHHLVEDTGIVLGQAIKEALGDKTGITRYGKAIIPMDEALVLCAIDISNRPYSEIDDPFTISMLGEFQTEMVSEFFKALAMHSGLNIQTVVFRGTNNHHIVEGTFKAFARAFLEAISISKKFALPSSKGVL